MLTLRESPPAHPETMPRGIASTREVGQHAEEANVRYLEMSWVWRSLWALPGAVGAILVRGPPTRGQHVSG
eukprot:7396139-Pyramimonas_sp.AAC.1